MKEFDYGKEILNMRLKAGISQGAVARELGFTTPQFISNWERGISTVPPTRIKTLAKIYKVTPKKLIDLSVKDFKQKTAKQSGVRL